jgi:hypothetical protein
MRWGSIEGRGVLPEPGARVTAPTGGGNPFVDTEVMKFGRAFWVLMVAGGVVPVVGNGCGDDGKAASPDTGADTAAATGGTASGGVGGTGGAATGGSIGGGGMASGGAGGIGGTTSAGGSGGMGGVVVGAGGIGGTTSAGGQGGAGGALDGGGGLPDGAGAGEAGIDAIAAGVDAESDVVRRFACGGGQCVVGESYCRFVGSGTGGTIGAGGSSGAGGSTGGPPGSCTAFPTNCTTRLDCTCFCGSPSCSSMTSQCTATDGNVFYTLFSP